MCCESVRLEAYRATGGSPKALFWPCLSFVQLGTLSSYIHSNLGTEYTTPLPTSSTEAGRKRKGDGHGFLHPVSGGWKRSGACLLHTRDDTECIDLEALEVGAGWGGS